MPDPDAGTKISFGAQVLTDLGVVIAAVIGGIAAKSKRRRGDDPSSEAAATDVVIAGGSFTNLKLMREAVHEIRRLANGQKEQNDLIRAGLDILGKIDETMRDGAGFEERVERETDIRLGRIIMNHPAKPFKPSDRSPRRDTFKDNE